MQKLGYGPDKPLAVTVTTRNVAAYRDPAVILIDQLKEIDIDGTLNPIDTTQWYPTVMRKDYTLAFTVSETGLDDPDQMFYENYSVRLGTQLYRLLQSGSRQADRPAIGRDRRREAAADRLADREIPGRGRRPADHLPPALGDLLLSAGQGDHGRRQQPLQRMAHGRRLAGQIAPAHCRPREGFGKTAPGLFGYRNFGDLATISGVAKPWPMPISLRSAEIAATPAARRRPG